MLDFQFPLNAADIEKLIPHRAPFLLVDKVMAIEPGKRIEAVKVISANEPVLKGHFPGDPVYPGVYLVEGLAQAAAILGRVSTQSMATTVYLTEVGSARFRKIVRPGDCLRYEVDLERHRAPFFWFHGRVLCENELVADVKLSARMA